jgi:hypothetical protein
MTRKTTRRKHWPLVNPIQMAIEGARITQGALLDKLRVRELSAIESFAKGNAVHGDWSELADMHNVCKPLVSMGLGGDDAKQACELADQALQSSHASQAERGKLGMTGPQIQAMRELYEWHDAQRTVIHRGKYEQAIVRTVNVIRGGRADVVRME